MLPGSLKVLYVDDDQTDLALFGIAIEEAGLNIWLSTVTNGKKAVEYLEGKGEFDNRDLFPLPDVILLDFRMPVMSGFDFLAWRRRSAFTSLPVIVFASSVQQSDKLQAISLGADSYMEKPAGLEELEDAARKIWDFASQWQKQSR